MQQGRKGDLQNIVINAIIIAYYYSLTTVYNYPYIKIITVYAYCALTLLF